MCVEIIGATVRQLKCLCINLMSFTGIYFFLIFTADIFHWNGAKCVSFFRKNICSIQLLVKIFQRQRFCLYRDWFYMFFSLNGAEMGLG